MVEQLVKALEISSDYYYYSEFYNLVKMCVAKNMAVVFHACKTGRWIAIITQIS